jgi:hypothetical protein
MPKAKDTKPESSLPSKDGDFGSILKLPILPVLATIPDEKTALHVAEAFKKRGCRSLKSPFALRLLPRPCWPSSGNFRKWWWGRGRC